MELLGVLNLRKELSKAERLLNQSISFIKKCNNSNTLNILIEARNSYENLYNLTRDKKLKLLLQRRIHGRINRIIRAIEKNGKLEAFEELDERGQQTGYREISTIAHLRGIRHASVNVIVFNRKSQILLQLRAPTTPVFPARWTFSASGHVASGQTPLDAAIAETIEEVSVYINPEGTVNLLDSAKQIIKTTPDDTTWIRLYPKKEKFRRIGLENNYDGYLYGVEFVYLDEREKHKLIVTTKELLRVQKNTGIERVLWNVNELTNTLFLFIFDCNQQKFLKNVVSHIKENTGIPPGMMTHNIEKKSLYVYCLDEREEDIVEAIITLKKEEKKPIGPGLTSEFRWFNLEQIVREFNASPENFTDAFAPFLCDSSIVDRIIHSMQHGGKNNPTKLATYNKLSKK